MVYSVQAPRMMGVGVGNLGESKVGFHEFDSLWIARILIDLVVSTSRRKRNEGRTLVSSSEILTQKEPLIWWSLMTMLRGWLVSLSVSMSPSPEFVCRVG